MVVLDTLLTVSGVPVAISRLLSGDGSYIRDQQEVQTADAPSELALFVAYALSAVGLTMAVYIGTQKAATQFPSTVGNEIKAIESGNETH